MNSSEKYNLEETKVFLDYLKHLATLSTGSILLIVAFLEKLFSNPSGKIAIVVSLVGFMVSVLASVVAYTVAVFFDAVRREPPALIGFLGGFGVLFSWVGFLVGILSFALFAFLNLTQ